MKKTIVILEDNDERQSAMKDCLENRLPMCPLVISDDPDTVIHYLSENSDNVLIVSLDHDLYDRADASTSLTGMMVAEYLATLAPTFPLLLHTTNTIDGTRMQTLLAEHGWKVEWIVPFDGINWIAKEWYHTLKRAIFTTRPLE